MTATMRFLFNELYESCLEAGLRPCQVCPEEQQNG